MKHTCPLTQQLHHGCVYMCVCVGGGRESTGVEGRGVVGGDGLSLGCYCRAQQDVEHERRRLSACASSRPLLSPLSSLLSPLLTPLSSRPLSHKQWNESKQRVAPLGTLAQCLSSHNASRILLAQWQLRLPRPRSINHVCGDLNADLKVLTVVFKVVCVPDCRLTHQVEVDTDCGLTHQVEVDCVPDLLTRVTCLQYFVLVRTLVAAIKCWQSCGWQELRAAGACYPHRIASHRIAACHPHRIL